MFDDRLGGKKSEWKGVLHGQKKVKILIELFILRKNKIYGWH
jgi:hypothetical protein